MVINALKDDILVGANWDCFEFYRWRDDLEQPFKFCALFQWQHIDLDSDIYGHKSVMCSKNVNHHLQEIL